MKAILRDLQVALIERAREMLIHDSNFVDTVIEAYNRYQDNERDGVDCLFNIFDKEDVKCCFDGGLSVSEFVSAYFDRETRHFTSYFFFGVNHPKPSFIISKEQLAAVLQNSLADIMPHMFCNPNIKEYSALYEALVSDYMYDNEMV